MGFAARGEAFQHRRETQPMHQAESEGDDPPEAQSPADQVFHGDVGNAHGDQRFHQFVRQLDITQGRQQQRRGMGQGKHGNYREQVAKSQRGDNQPDQKQ